MNHLTVQKYGGTSVGSLERIQKVASHIAHTLRSEERVVVVVSAMGTYTDELLQSAYSLHPFPPKRELDMLITTGERISMALLSIALANLGIPSISLTGSQSGILTDGNHGNARIEAILGERIRQGLKEKKVVIVAGFQGVNPLTKDITSLGRGGSDLTAIALAVNLGASQCQIYTDVDGVLTADPRLIPTARVLSRLCWQEMVELAWAGAGVLHHRGAFVAAKYRLPVEVRCSLNPERVGTRIEGSPMMEKAYITAITYKKNQCLLSFRCRALGEAAASLGVSLCLRWLWQEEESPPLVQQKQGSEGESDVQLLFGAQHADRFASYLAAIQGKDGQDLQIISRHDRLGLISLVGQGFRQSPELVAEVFAAFGKTHIHYGESRDNILSFVVDEGLVEALVTQLHERFLEESKKVP